MDKPATCFSPVNFELVYHFIEAAVKAEKSTFFQYEGYEIYVSDRSVIAFKERGYSLARIDKERGIFSLAKRQKDNDRIVKKANQIFCALLAAAVAGHH